MARHLGLLPGRQLGVSGAELLAGLALELADLLLDVDAAGLLAAAELVDLQLEFGERALEIQEVTHRGGLPNPVFGCARG